MAHFSHDRALNDAIVNAGLTDWTTLANYEIDELLDDLSLDGSNADRRIAVQQLIMYAKKIEKGNLNVILNTSLARSAYDDTLTRTDILGTVSSEPFLKTARVSFEQRIRGR